MSSRFFLVTSTDTHLVQGPLILPGHGLHDGCEEGLGVEEASQPHHSGQGEVGRPGLQLLVGSSNDGGDRGLPELGCFREQSVGPGAFLQGPRSGSILNRDQEAQGQGGMQNTQA